VFASYCSVACEFTHVHKTKLFRFMFSSVDKKHKCPADGYKKSYADLNVISLFVE